ncbi:MAG: helix-turn-helix transcriptional regulator, partial [Acidobacteriota bacterium]|nr:helix-turn-helix transcriptional regulator [Acidobacteriota bacterium]
MLRQLRGDRGLSLSKVEELTAKLGSPVSRSRLSELERGDVSVHFDDVQVLCRVYGMDLADLFIEALAARPSGCFQVESTAEELFEEGKRLFDEGKPLEAGWAFDAAAEAAAGTDGEMAGLARTSASFCYDRMGARDLALRRVEQALDLLDGQSEARWRATALMAVLLASSGAAVRARVFLEATLAVMEAGVPPRLRVFLLDNCGSALHLLGELSEATRLSLEAARLYRRLGEFDWCALKLAAAATYESEQGRQKLALRHARDAEGMLDDLKRVDTRIAVLTALGRVLVAEGAEREARNRLEEAFRIADLHGLKVRARDVCELLEHLARQQGDRSAQRLWRKRLDALPGAGFDGFSNGAG